MGGMEGDVMTIDKHFATIMISIGFYFYFLTNLHKELKIMIKLNTEFYILKTQKVFIIFK